MTLSEQAQAEAKSMVEQFEYLRWEKCEASEAMLPKHAAKGCAIISIDKIISLRVQPMEYYEQVKQAIINL